MEVSPLLLLGIDLGTTGVKVILVSQEGQTVGQGYSSYPSLPGSTGEHEQDPAEWWQALQNAMTALHATVGAATVRTVAAVGLSGHMHGLVLVDSNGVPVRPCMTWADRKPVAQAEELRRTVGTTILERCGNPVMEAFTAPKLLWVAQNEPEVLNRASRLVLPKDYLRWMLTGEWATDGTDAAGTLMFDLKTQSWDMDLVLRCGGRPDMLPPVLSSMSTAGIITPAASRATGLPAGIPVVCGASDVACAALGAGLAEPGATCLNIGTAAQIFTVTSKPVPGRHFVFQHCLPGRFLAMGSLFAAGLSLSWYVNNYALHERLEAEKTGENVYAILDRLASKVPPGARRLLYLPYLAGSSLPNPNPLARGAFVGLTTQHGRAETVRAIMEGVAFSLRDVLDSFEKTGLPVSDLRVGGGGARSQLWTQIFADVFNRRLTVLREEASPLGAAMLAGIGVGVFSNPQEAIASCVRSAGIREPNPREVESYRRYYEVFRTLCSALSPVYHSLAEAPE